MLDDFAASLSLQAIGILAPILIAFAIEFIRQLIGDAKLKKIAEEIKANEQLARLAVLYAQQKFSDLNGADKYEEAIKWFVIEAEKRGMKVGTPEEIEGFIESALKLLKNEFGEQWKEFEDNLED